MDVEDYFQVEAFSSLVEPSAWSAYEPRVDGNTRLVLDVFSEYGVRGTFFVVGWIAERQPALVREIVRRGHEIACHSYWHRPVYRLTPAEFREDTRRAKAVLEDIAGIPVRGYRAPTFSIIKETTWALEILAELGFQYDSSVYPIRHDRYGIPDWDRSPRLVETPAGPILEIPASTVRWMGVNFPCGGGGYLRLLPLSFHLMALRGIWERERLHGVIYLHPWEFDPDQPRFSAGFLSTLRHYTGLRRTEERVRRLLSELNVGPVSERMLPLLEQIDRCAPVSPARL